MFVSVATGGKPADVQAAVNSAIAAAAGDNADQEELGQEIALYVSKQLKGVPAGVSAAVQVHVHIAVNSPAPEGSHPNAGPTIEEIKAASTEAAKAAVAQMITEHKLALGIVPTTT